MKPSLSDVVYNAEGAIRYNNLPPAENVLSSNDLASHERTTSPCNDLDLLPPDFEPGVTDVICQRGKDSFEHPGNHRFRVLIGEHLDEYLKAPSRHGKSKIVSNIYDQIRSSAKQPSNGFVRKNMLTRRWSLVDNKEAKEKVAQALRDSRKMIRGTRAAKRVQAHNQPAIKHDQEMVADDEHGVSNDSTDQEGTGDLSSIDSRLFSLCQMGTGLLAGAPSSTPTVSPPLFAAKKLEDLERYKQWLATNNNTLESSIQPIGVVNNEKRFSPAPHYNVLVGSDLGKFSFLPESRHQAVLPGTDICQQPSSFTVIPSKGIPDFTSSTHDTTIPHTTISQMLLHQNNNSTATQRQLMGGRWDLEPTPIQFHQTGASEPVDQRTAALARMLFNEG